MLLSVVVKCSLEFINIKLIPHIKCRVWDTLQGQWLLEHWENQQLHRRSQTTIKKREVSICDRVSTVLHKAAGNTCTQQSAADLLMLSKFHFCFCIKSPEIHKLSRISSTCGNTGFHLNAIIYRVICSNKHTFSSQLCNVIGCCRAGLKYSADFLLSSLAFGGNSNRSKSPV